MAPRWPLKQVKQLAAADQIVLSQSKAVAHFGSYEIAKETAKRVVADLHATDFAYTISQQDECDLYGVKIGLLGYYLKITVLSGPRLMVVSLHPLKAPLLTKKGTVTP